MIKSSIGTRIAISVIGVDGVEREVAVTSNRFTTNGLQQWATGNLGSNLAIGSGSRDEIASGDSLVALSKTASGSWSYTNTNVIDSANGVMRSDAILSATFAAETAPQIYTELGIYRDSASSLQTYALIRDGDGVPTSITVLVGEMVRVAYLVQYSLPLLHVTEQEIKGVTTTVTTVPRRTGANVAARLPGLTASNIRAWPAGAGIPTAGALPAGGTVSPVAATLSGGEWRLNLSTAQWQLPGGVALVAAGGYSEVAVMMHFDPPLPNAGAGMIFAISSTTENGSFYGA